MARCGDENFIYDKKNESAYADVRELQCIEDKAQMNLGGAWTTKRLEMINICLAPCTNSSANSNKCGSTQQIKDYLRLDAFELRFASQYFDFNDQVTPIKKFIEDRYFLPIQTSQKKSMNVFARKSTVTLNDGIIPFFGNGESIEFVKVDNIKPYNSEIGYNYDNCYILISLRMDFEGELLTRDVYTFTDLLSDIGGIYSSLFAFGAIIVGIFSETLFYKQMIKDIYQARPSKRGQTERSTVTLRPTAYSSQIKIVHSEKESDFSNSLPIRNKIQSKDQSLINNIIHQILNRVNFKINLVDLLRTVFQKFIGKKQIRQNLKYRSVYLYNKGVKKIDNEFDAISLIKLMKQVKLLTSTLLNPTQKMMLGFQKQNVLDSDSSDNNSEEDDVALVKKLRSQNKFIRLMALGRVKHNIQGYFNQERKFKEIDHKLVKGIINNYEGEAHMKLKGFPKIKQKINEINEERMASHVTDIKQRRRLLNLISNDMYEVIEKQKDTKIIKNEENKRLSRNLEDLLLDQEKFGHNKQITPLERSTEDMQKQKLHTQNQSRYDLNESQDGLVNISNLEFKS
eukprot:403344852